MSGVRVDVEAVTRPFLRAGQRSHFNERDEHRDALKQLSLSGIDFP
jgi:hypothetical protein